jgi:hypothetical protein
MKTKPALKKTKAKNPMPWESTFTLTPEQSRAIQATMPKKYPDKTKAIFCIQEHLRHFLSRRDYHADEPKVGEGRAQLQELYTCLNYLWERVWQLNQLTKDALDVMFMQYLRDTSQSLDERPLPSELLNQLTALLRVLSPSVNYALHAPVSTTGESGNKWLVEQLSPAPPHRLGKKRSSAS